MASLLNKKNKVADGKTPDPQIEVQAPAKPTQQHKAAKPVKGRIKRAKMSTLAIVRAVTIILLTIFAMQNLSTVSVRFLLWSADVPLFAVALFVGVVGLVLGYLTGNRNTARRLNAKK